jgi:hypothetical protein
MSFEKLFDGIASVPAGPVHIKPNGISFQPSINVAQKFEKPFSIPPFCLNHAIASQQRIDPARDIQAHTMLAGRGNFKTLSFLRPAPAKPGVHRKACLILEYHGLFWPQGLKFFLKPAGTFGLLGFVLEDKNNLLSLTDNPNNASSVGLAAPSDLSRKTVSNESQPLAHPIEPGLNQMPAETSLSVPPASFESLPLTVKVFPILAWSLRTLSRLGSPRESNGLNSSGSALTPRLSIPDVVPQVPGVRRLSLCLSKPLVFARPMLINLLCWPLYALRLMWDFSCPHFNINKPLCHFI